MTVSSTATRSLKIGNETSLAGSETMTSEIGGIINSIIPAVTDDHPVTLPDFTKANLVGLLLTSERDALVRLSGSAHNISAVVAQGFTAVDAFTIAEDVTEWLWAGDTIWVDNATTPGNDGTAIVITVAYAVPYSTVTIMREGAAYNVEVGAATTVFRKIMARSQEHLIDGAALLEFVAPSTINALGDMSFLQQYDKIMIQGATNAANNDIFNVVDATFTTPDTAITILEATLVGETAVAATSLQWVRDQLMVRLTAGIPMMWTINGFGVLNPCLEDITTLLVSNAHATLTSDFQARILTVPV